MRVWLVCFLMLFALAKLFEWIQKFQLPLPIYILGGAFLAVASNYDKFFSSYVSHGNGEVPSEKPLLDSPSQPTPSLPFTISPHCEDLPQSQIK